MLAIRLSPDIQARLANLAAQTGKSEADYAAEVLAAHLQDLEDLHTAEQRLADIREGKAQTVGLQEVMAEYGLAD